ncbi:MAG: class I SAM-dependent DNA methyltransferase [Bacteroidota bacterium]
MARHDALYRRALYYDIALRRDVDREVDFIRQVYHQHSAKALSSILEIGCGPGYHARALARRGIRVSALDINPEMLEIAREYAAAEAIDVDWIEADMKFFHVEKPVEMAVCLFDGIDALLTDRDVDDHLHSVAANLVDGGLYLVDCTHPRDCSLSDYGSYSYQGSRDGIDVEIIWGTNRPEIDVVTGIAEVATQMIVRNGGETVIIDDVARERCFTAQELKLLVERTGLFRVAEWYGDFSIAQPLDSSERSRRMIAVLRKRAD